MRVGPYEVMGRLGSGGMGHVYLARSTGGERLVALKTIRPELSAVPDYRVRFAREIEVARRVRSPYIARLVDFDATHEVPWLATELVRGPNLAEVLTAHGPLPAHSVRVLAAGLAQALTAVHAAGIVHRDVKPSNVILSEKGPRLVDFGIARPVRQAGLTSTGQFVGTSAYASPEQLLTQKVGPRSDMFSLGVLLAESAGLAVCSPQRPPLAADVISGRSPSLSPLPQDLRTLVRRCLAGTPADRPAPAEVPGLLTGLARPSRQNGRPWLPGPVRSSVRRSSQALWAVTHPATAVDAGRMDQQPTATAHKSRVATGVMPGARTPASALAGGRGPALKAGLLSAAGLLLVAGVAVAGVAVAGQDGDAEAGRGPRDAMPGVTVTASVRPPDDKPKPRTSSSRTAPTPAPTPVRTPAESVRKPSAAAAGQPTFTRGTLGVSSYRKPGYRAAVTSVTAHDHTLTVSLRATGEPDLRKARTTCLVVRGPDGTFTVHPFTQDARTDRPGTFDGTLTFPLLVSGKYVLRYSCEDDYSDVDLGTARVPRVGVSRYSDKYFAVVLSAKRTAGGLQLVFASTGPSDLRDPRSSCLNRSGVAEQPEQVRLSRSETMLHHFHYGVMDFPPVAAGSSFTYSCRGDYSPVALP
ncbi:protein kinase [Streptomyces yangpuensis]|uniref:protein kinase domain-containing protein n=1 Tax=Streptomyces yangpuensis TaxID=1648182 RepID=UPI00372400D7